ncbi:MAG: hypothetical protein HYV63_32925 [Candidatus Schekmanbacteria bacterium]|nr:hypothetical protein [Candidatus Schekmanbacteria bacterium]
MNRVFPKKRRKAPAKAAPSAADEEARALLARLEDAAHKLSITVRYAADLPREVGAVRIASSTVVFIHRMLEVPEKAALLAEQIALLAGERLDEVYVLPEVRELIAAHAATRPPVGPASSTSPAGDSGPVSA